MSLPLSFSMEHFWQKPTWHINILQKNYFLNSLSRFTCLLSLSWTFFVLCQMICFYQMLSFYLKRCFADICGTEIGVVPLFAADCLGSLRWSWWRKSQQTIVFVLDQSAIHAWSITLFRFLSDRCLTSTPLEPVFHHRIRHDCLVITQCIFCFLRDVKLSHYQCLLPDACSWACLDFQLLLSV